MASERINKVNELIQHELARVVQRELEFPENTLVTVMRVQTDGDLKKARVFISALPKTKEKDVLKIIRKRSPLLQGILNRTLVMRYVPELSFSIETEQAKRNEDDEIDRILDQIHDELSG